MASKRLIPLQTEAEELTKIFVTMVKKVKERKTSKRADS